jgi:PilZ domain
MLRNYLATKERTNRLMASASPEDGHATARIAPRYQFEARIAVRTQSGETREGWARDISESGLGAFVAREIALGEAVVLTFRLTESVRLILPAQVLSVDGTRYGFRFTALSAEQRADIQTAMRHHSEVGARGRSQHSNSEGQSRLSVAKRDEPVMSFAERARKIIKSGYTPKVAVELALHELESEQSSNPWVMEKARADAEEFLRKVRDGII